MYISKKHHFVIAFLLWFTIGIIFLTVGTFWFVSPGFPMDHNPLNLGITAAIYILCILIGYTKYNFVIKKVGKKIIARIEGFAEKSSPFITFSLKNWSLIAVMISAGMMIRYFQVPISIKMVIYVIIGAALLLSSSVFWQALKSLNMGDSNVEFDS